MRKFFISLMFVFMFALVTTTNVHAVPSDGVLYLSFDECSGTVVYDHWTTSDGIAQNFSRQNEAFYNTTNTPNGTGCSGGVDGVNDYWRDSTSTGLNIETGDSLTLSMDVYFVTFGGNNGILYIGEGNAGVNRYVVRSDGVNKTKFEAMGMGGSTLDYALETGKWYNLVYVFDNSNDMYLFYVNGTNVVNVTSRTSDNNNTLIDSRVSESYASPPQVYFDNIRIYKSVLNSSEIQSIYETDFGIESEDGIPSGYRAYYPINESTGTILYSASGSAYTNTFTTDSGYVTWLSGSECQDGGVCARLDGGRAFETNGGGTASARLYNGSSTTMYLWAKVDSISDQDVIMHRADSFGIKASGSNIIAEIKDGSGYHNFVLTATSNILGDWHLFSLAYNESSGFIEAGLDCSTFVNNTITGSPLTVQYSGIGGGTLLNNVVNNGTYQHYATYQKFMGHLDCESFMNSTQGEDSSAPTWDEEPFNISIFNNTAFSVDWNATDDVAIDKYFANHSDIVTMNPSTGVMGNATTITPGNYSIGIWVNDTSNNTLSGVFNLEIKEYIPPPELGDLVLYLSFDNTSNCGQTDDNYTSDFTVQGSASCVENDICKMYGCANFTATSGDYLNSTNNFSLADEMTVSYWIYPIQRPTGSDSQGYWEMSQGDHNSDYNYKYAGEGGYGHQDTWYTSLYKMSTSLGESKYTIADSWTHYCTQYDGSRFLVYKNGVLESNTSASYGNLNYTSGEPISVGKMQYGIDLIGYMDEFRVWNSSNVNCVEQYNLEALGTPPDLDVFVKSIKYNLNDFRNWSKNNTVTDYLGASMPINITIRNQGVSGSASNFEVRIWIDDTIVDSFNTTISTESEVTYVYNWTTSLGYHTGFVQLDATNVLSEDNEENNNQSIYIPFLDRPFTEFNLTYWYSTLLPFCQNSSNKVAYSACSFFHTTWTGSDDFSSSWTAEDVDPRGKKARENAMGCLRQNYNMSEEPCVKAMNHLFGWGNITASQWGDAGTSVQSIHELSHVAHTFDIMFPALNRTTVELLSEQYHEICQQITNRDNTRPDIYPADYDEIGGGNGWGFGSGMGEFCEIMLGEFSENPTMIQNITQRYHSPSIEDSWTKRLKSYLKGFKNESTAKYQERWLYQFYSSFHVMEILFADKNTGRNQYVDYNNAVCSMANTIITDLLDNNYNGQTLRSDENRYWRGIQAGDSNSYEDIGTDSVMGAEMISFLALNCDNTTIKESLAYLRNKWYDENSVGGGILGMIAYPQAILQITSVPTNIYNYPKFFYDNANDIVTYRNNYTYKNDTVIQVDGGEEKGSGHSQAQGFYLYALGEPFLDYEQVPNGYNGADDVRAEDFKNAIAFQNRASTQGSRDTYSSTCGNAVLNQYYGMLDCPDLGTYPDYRSMPLNLTGDLENYNGKSGFMGVTKWMPYYPDNKNVTEIFVVWGDIMARHVEVESSNTGNIYDNNLALDSEFNFSVSGMNFTQQRIGTTKKLDVKTIWTNTTATVVSENSTYKPYPTKTGSTPLNGYYQRTFLNISADSANFVRGYNWYYDGEATTMTQIGTTDKGLLAGTKNIGFDTSGDDIINISTYSSDGDSMGYDETNNEYFTNGATYFKKGSTTLMSANESVSVFIESGSDEYKVTINTWKIADYIDEAKPVLVTIDASNLTNTSGLYVQKNGENISSTQMSTSVTFLAVTELSGTEYTILGTSSTTDTTFPYWNETPTGFSFFNTSSVSVQYNASDDVAIDKYFINDSTYFTMSTGGLLANASGLNSGNYSLLVSVNDTSGNTNSTSIIIEALYEAPPVIPDNITISFTPKKLVSNETITSQFYIYAPNAYYENKTTGTIVTTDTADISWQNTSLITAHDGLKAQAPITGDSTHSQLNGASVGYNFTDSQRIGRIYWANTTANVYTSNTGTVNSILQYNNGTNWVNAGVTCTLTNTGQKECYNTSSGYFEVNANATAIRYLCEASGSATNDFATCAIDYLAYTTLNETATYLNATNDTITFYSDSYYSKNQTIEALNTSNKNILGIYDSLLTVRGFNITGGESIYNISGYIYNSAYNYNVSYSNTSNQSQIYLTKGLNYTIHFEGTDYTAYESNNYKNITLENNTQTETFNLYRDKSIFIYVKDILTSSSINEVTLQLIGSSYYNYTFNGSIFKFPLTTGTYNSVINASGYTTIYPAITVSTGRIFNQTYYLSSEATTTEVTFYIRDKYSLVYLEDAFVEIIRVSDSEVVASGYTDFTGGVEFELQEGINYEVRVSKDDYVDYEASINLIESIYTIDLTSEAVSTPGYYTGISYNFTPSGTIDNDSMVNLTFGFNSAGTWSITDCYFIIQNTSFTTIYEESSSSCGSSLTVEVNTTGMYEVIGYGVLTLNDTINITYIHVYTINTLYEGDASLFTALKNTANFNKAGSGTNDFFKYLIIFIIILGAVLSLTLDTEILAGSDRIILLIWAFIGAFSVAGMLTLSFIKIAFIAQYGVFLLISLYLLGTLIKNYTD